MAVMTRGTAEFSAAVKAHPNILSNQTISNVKLNSQNSNSGDWVVLENLVIRNLTLDRVQMWRAHFKDVTFIDCHFINADFDGARFENVKFIRGSLSGYAKPPNSFTDLTTSFKNVTIDRLLFDGVFFGPYVSSNFINGIVVIRNVTTTPTPPEDSVLLGGHNLQVRMHNCTVHNQDALGLTGESTTVYVTDSKFVNATLWASNGKAAWIENCDLTNSGTPSTETTVITRCRVKGVRAIGLENRISRCFLVDNEYLESPAPHVVWLGSPQHYRAPNVEDPTDFSAYIYGNGPIPGNVSIMNGKIYIQNATIGSINMRQQSFNAHVDRLDMKNVTVQQGAWVCCDVGQGKWENVIIYPPVDLRSGKIGDITGYNVRFPKGSPWVNGSIAIQESKTALEFALPLVPTLDQLNIADFWQKHDYPLQEF